MIGVFPTPVGMNRAAADPSDRWGGVPHARGDEPVCLAYGQSWPDVFPTPVGMNRYMTRFLGMVRRVPHARGDEPEEEQLLFGDGTCSPRPWG